MDHTKGLAMRINFLARLKIENTLDNLFESATIALQNLEYEVNEVLFGRSRGGNI